MNIVHDVVQAVLTRIDASTPYDTRYLIRLSTTRIVNLLLTRTADRK